MIVSFVLRNPAYALKNWRSLAATRRAMVQHRKENYWCAWCERTKKLEVHHIIPVKVDPFKAGLRENMITLCRPDHLRCGHNGDFGRRYAPDIAVQAIENRVILIKAN